MGIITAIRIKFLMVTSLILCISCDNSIQEPSFNALDFFPIENNLKWTFERSFNYYENDSLTTNSIDTLIYSMKEINLSDGRIAYEYYNGNRVIDTFIQVGDIIYSLTNADTSNHIFWKKELTIGEEWISFESWENKILSSVMHKVIDLNTVINVRFATSPLTSIIIDREIHHLGLYKERCYYAKDIGLVFVTGSSSFLQYASEYELELINFKSY